MAEHPDAQAEIPGYAGARQLVSGGAVYGVPLLAGFERLVRRGWCATPT